MAAYIIVDLLEISDPATFQDYAQKAGPTVAKYGGKALVARGKLETFEGQWKPGNVVVLEFPNMARAKEWHNSTEYQPLKAQRMKSARTNMILVEGV